MAHLNRDHSTEKALVVLTGTILAVAVFGVMYWAQKVLIPVALAWFFAFLLAPVVLQVQRWGLNRAVWVIGGRQMLEGELRDMKIARNEVLSSQVLALIEDEHPANAHHRPSLRHSHEL
jgi:hypothetical protein